MDKRQLALEFRKAVEYFIATLNIDTEEEKILEIPSMFPKYKVGVAYKTKDIFKYGENAVGDAQLYQVLQDHTSAEQWTPDTATSLYKAIGVNEDGIPTWVQPLGATDAYNTGDVVLHNEKYWKSDVDNNTWEPGVYGWTETTV